MSGDCDINLELWVTVASILSTMIGGGLASCVFYLRETREDSRCEWNCRGNPCNWSCIRHDQVETRTEVHGETGRVLALTEQVRNLEGALQNTSRQNRSYQATLRTQHHRIQRQNEKIRELNQTQVR